MSRKHKTETREEFISRQFTELTGLEAVRVDECVPHDYQVAIHTETRTWEAIVTHTGYIKPGTFQELPGSKEAFEESWKSVQSL